MRRTEQGLWVAVVIVGILDLAVFISHAKVPDKIPASTPQVRPLKPPATGKIKVDVSDLGGRRRHGHCRPMGGLQRYHAYDQRQALA